MMFAARLTSGNLFPAVLALGCCCACPAVAGSVATGSPAAAPQKGVNISSGPKAPASDQPVALLQMSAELLAFGRETKDPLALIVTARIMKALGSTEVDLKPEGRAANDNSQKSGQPVTADSILIEARDLGKGDKLTNLLIDEAGAMRSEGAMVQPKTHQDTVRPGATDIYMVVFNGGQLAEAGIAGDGGSDLDLLVYDENDHLVCRSDSSSDREYCRWWPRWTGPFRIEIQNLGTASNLYRVATN
ncbi:MAG: hypothetical protein JO358_12545 [Alphaproteobacteria bacterium]|nr:hypothetical protein [Alphaproteobacteria bacterium]